MSLPMVQNIDGRWFVGGCWGRVSSNGYFHCHEKSCPFSAKLVMRIQNGKKVPIAVEAPCSLFTATSGKIFLNQKTRTLSQRRCG